MAEGAHNRLDHECKVQLLHRRESQPPADIDHCTQPQTQETREILENSQPVQAMQHWRNCSAHFLRPRRDIVRVRRLNKPGAKADSGSEKELLEWVKSIESIQRVDMRENSTQAEP